MNATHTDPGLVTAFRRLAGLAAAAVGAVAVLVLLGWTFQINLFKSLWPGQTATRPLTALGILLLAAALWLLNDPARPSAWRRVALVCAGLAALLGLVFLLEYASGVDLGPDRWLFPQAVLADNVPPIGRPAPATALCLLLLGLALLALDRKPRWLTPAGALLSLVIAGLALIGYTYESTTLYQIGPYVPIAPLTALLLALFAAGLLAAQPEGALMGVLTTNLVGSTISRRLLPIVIVLPFTLGLLRLYVQRLGLLDLGFGMAVVVTSNVVGLSAVIWASARLLNQSDARRAQAHETLREREQRLQVLADATPNGLLTVADSGQITWANVRAERLFGFEAGGLLGQPVDELLPARYRDSHTSDRAGFATARLNRLMGVGRDLFALRRDGREFPVEVGLIPIDTPDGPQTLASVVDITGRKQAEENLRQLNAELEQRVAARTAELAANEAKLRALFEALPVGVSILDKYRRIVDSNPALDRILRPPGEALVASTVTERVFLRPDGSRMPMAEFASVRAFEDQRPVADVETGVVTEAGETIWTSVSAVPLQSDGVVVVTVDITERKQAELALRESRERFAAAFNFAPIGMSLVTIEGQFVQVNPALCQLVGYTEAELLRLSFQAISYPDDLEADLRNVQQLMAGAIHSYQLEKRYYHKLGHLVWVLLNISMVCDPAGAPLYFIAQIQDISERKRTEAALAASEERQRHLFEEAQRQTKELTVRDMLHQALARDLAVPEVLRLLVEGVAATLGYTLVSLYLLDGDTLRLQHQVGYHQVIETVHISQGVSGRVVRSGQPALLTDVRHDPNFLGAIEGIESEICIPLFDQGQVAGILNVESPHSRPLTEADLRLMQALGEQVSFALGRARLAGQVRESQERFASAFNHASIGMALVAPDGRWLAANPALCRLVGYTEAEMQAIDFQAITHADDLDADLAHVQQMLAGSIQSYQMEKRYLHKLGRVVWALLSVSLVHEAGGRPRYFISQIQDITERKQAEQALAEQARVLAAERDLMQALMDNIPDTIYFKDTASRFTRVNRAQAHYLGLPSPEAAIGLTDLDLQPAAQMPEIFAEEQQLMRTGQPLLNRIDLVTAADGQARWISSTKVPLKADGRIVGLVGVSRDISGLKQAEARLLASLQEKEVLLKEIHHRVKNNLQIVSSLLHLQAEAVDDPRLREAFDDAQRRVRTMALVHEQLYRAPDLAHIDFGEYARGLLNYLRRSQVRSGNPLQVRLEIEDITLEIDRAIPLGLLVNELVTNSLKYAFAPGAAAGAAPAEVWVSASRDAAGTLTLVVGDTGGGLPETVDLDHPASMGLQLVQSFVLQLRARLSVQRRPGTVYTLVIPARSGARG